MHQKLVGCNALGNFSQTLELDLRGGAPRKRLGRRKGRSKRKVVEEEGRVEGEKERNGETSTCSSL